MPGSAMVVTPRSGRGNLGSLPAMPGLELGDRLTVGLWTLDPSIQVRILVSQLRPLQTGNPSPAADRLCPNLRFGNKVIAQHKALSILRVTRDYLEESRIQRNKRPRPRNPVTRNLLTP